MIQKIELLGNYLGIEIYYDSSKKWGQDDLWVGRMGRHAIEPGFMNVDTLRYDPIKDPSSLIDQDKPRTWTPEMEHNVTTSEIEWVLGGADDLRYYMPLIRKLIKTKQLKT